MHTLLRCGLLASSLIWDLGFAVERVQVVGLLKDRAVLRIDGQQRIVKVGSSSPEGVQVQAVDTEAALLLINGTVQRLTLSASIGGRYQVPTTAEVRILPDNVGMYRLSGTINGQPVNFLVDTGATTVALNANLARSLGIDYARQPKGQVTTASGIATAYEVVLGRVGVGGISLPNVTAVVIEGNYPLETLLGLSFLNRLALENQGSLMILRQKFQ